MTPHKIAISSQKGGVAKTTTCVSLGACLAEQGLSVLLIDLDPQAHLTRSFAIDPNTLRRTIGDVLLYQATLLQISRESALPNIDLAPANRGLILVEKMLHTANAYEYRLKTAINAVTQSLQDRYYDIILFDCPPSFGPLTVNALTAADTLLIPLTCDYFAAQSLRSYLNLLDTLRRTTNPALQHRLLITMFESRTRLSRMMLEQYRQQFGPILFETLIPMDNKLRESAVFSRPITQFAASARSAQQYQALARELIKWINLSPNNLSEATSPTTSEAVSKAATN